MKNLKNYVLASLAILAMIFSSCSKDEQFDDNGAAPSTRRVSTNSLVGKWYYYSTDAQKNTTKFCVEFKADGTYSEYRIGDFEYDLNGPGKFNSSIVSYLHKNVPYTATATDFILKYPNQDVKIKYSIKDGKLVVNYSNNYSQEYTRDELVDNPMLGKWYYYSTDAQKNTTKFCVEFKADGTYSEYRIGDFEYDWNGPGKFNPSIVSYLHKNVPYTATATDFILKYPNQDVKIKYSIKDDKLVINYSNNYSQEYTRDELVDNPMVGKWYYYQIDAQKNTTKFCLEFKADGTSSEYRIGDYGPEKFNPTIVNYLYKDIPYTATDKDYTLIYGDKGSYTRKYNFKDGKLIVYYSGNFFYEYTRE